MARQLTKKNLKAPFIVIYGREGVGKTTLASYFPDPFVVDAEGRYYYDLPHQSVRRYQEIVGVLSNVMTSPYKTVVIDSVDSVQEMAFKDVMIKGNLKSISQNYREANSLVCQEMAFRFFHQLRDLNNNGKNVVCICHPKMIEMQDALVIGKWNAYTLKLTESKEISLSARLKEISDGVFFLAHDKPIVEKGRAQEATDMRILYTEYSPCYDAKNIWGLPDPITGATTEEIYDQLEKYLFPAEQGVQEEGINRADLFTKALELVGNDRDLLKSMCANSNVSFKTSSADEIHAFMRKVELVKELKGLEDDARVMLTLSALGCDGLEKATVEQLEQALQNLKEN